MAVGFTTVGSVARDPTYPALRPSLVTKLQIKVFNHDGSSQCNIFHSLIGKQTKINPIEITIGTRYINLFCIYKEGQRYRTRIKKSAISVNKLNIQIFAKTLRSFVWLVSSQVTFPTFSAVKALSFTIQSQHARSLGL